MGLGVKTRTLVKTIVIYLSVFALVCVLVSFLYASSLNVLYESTLKSGQSRLDDGVAAFGGQLMKMLSHAGVYASSEAYVKLKYVQREGRVQDSVYMLQAMDTLNRQLQLEEPYVKQIYALFKNNDIFISSHTSALSYRNAFGTVILNRGGEMTIDAWREAHFSSEAPVTLISAPHLYSPYAPQTKSFLLCVAKTNMVAHNRSDVIAFMIDADELAATLAEADILAISRIRILDGEGNALYESGADADEEGYLTITSRNTVYNISAELTVPRAFFDERLSEVTRIIRVYIAVGVGGIFILLVLIAINQYWPISFLLNMSAQYGNVEYSRNSYDFIGSAIQSVINAKNEADQRLALARSAGNNTLIFNALKYGSYTSRERDALKTLMGEIVQAYVVMVVRADGGREEHMNQMEALLRDRYRGRLVAAREDESEDILIAAVETEDAAEALYEAATTLYDAFLPHDVRLQIGLSERAWGIERLHGAYIEARYALTATENEPMNPVLRYGADVEMPRQESLTPSMLVKLNDIMFSGNGAGVVEFFDEALHALPIIGARFQTVYCAINMTVQSAANALGQKEDASSEYMADEDPEAALQRLQSRALAVCEMVVARRQNGSLRMRKSAIDYILENYADPNLCADEIADSLHISRNGVYRLLKETTGHTLAEYVEGVRIRKVEELLLSTDKGVEEIAELTGFGAVNTLYRVFKKRHGIPPGVWRKENDPNRTI